MLRTKCDSTACLCCNSIFLLCEVPKLGPVFLLGSEPAGCPGSLPHHSDTAALLQACCFSCVAPVRQQLLFAAWNTKESLGWVFLQCFASSFSSLSSCLFLVCLCFSVSAILMFVAGVLCLTLILVSFFTRQDTGRDIGGVISATIDFEQLMMSFTVPRFTATALEFVLSDLSLGLGVFGTVGSFTK